MNSITIFVIIIIVCTFIKITHKFYKKNDKYKRKEEYFVYDGTNLSTPAKKNLSFSSRNKKVDCNSNIVECNHNFDCDSKCKIYRNYKATCFNGICAYRNDKTICENGGQVVTYFTYGRNTTGCICPENFIGQFCQIRNEMKPADSKSFDIYYYYYYMPCGVGHITKNSTNVFSACRKRRLKETGRGDWESSPL